MKINEIEKSVPIPEVHSKIQYPWPKMEVGDSVLIEADDGKKLYNLKRKIGASARYYGEKTGKQFRMRIDYECNGVRVWRI
jgi:hypothetical protein